MTHIKFSKKELLARLFILGTKNYKSLLNEVQKDTITDKMEKRERFIKKYCGCVSIDDNYSSEIHLSNRLSLFYLK